MTSFINTKVSSEILVKTHLLKPLHSTLTVENVAAKLSQGESNIGVEKDVELFPKDLELIARTDSKEEV